MSETSTSGSTGQPGDSGSTGQGPSAGTTEQEVVFPPERTSWIGWIIFAGLMLGLMGIFQLVAGFVALVDEDYFQATGAAPLFLAVDQQTWGVLQLILGVLAILVAAGLMYGNVLARAVGIGIALVSAVSNLLAIGAYPFWSVILITVDVCILYAIAVHGREMKPSG